MKKFFTLSTLFALPFASLAQVDFSNVTSTLLINDLSSFHPIAIMDMNGDKRDDVIVLHTGEDPQIYFQNAPGAAFTEYVYPSVITNSNSWGMAGGDVNGDGFSDFVFGGSYNDLHLVTADGGTSSYSDSQLGVNIFLQGINMADIDNDGNLDIFACHDDGASVVLLGDGAGNFTVDNTHIDTDLPNGSDNSGNYGSVWTDIDNDCDIDLYIAKCRQGVSDTNDFRRINVLFLNNGLGTYTEAASAAGIASGEQSWSADFGDIDNDGDMDLIIGQHTTSSEIFENDGNGNFTDITATALPNVDNHVGYVIQTIFEDFDNDGWIDLLICGNHDWVICWNNGDGTFNYNNQPAVNWTMNSYAIGDVNSDGFIDIYTSPDGYPVYGSTSEEDSLYTNDGNSNNWLTVTLEGVNSNLEGIGARVEVHGPWGVQLREIRSGASYGIQNSLNAHFGLGTETEVDSVVVIWPDGCERDMFPNVPANQFYHVVEGSDTATDAISELPHLKVIMYPNPANEQMLVTVPDAGVDKLVIFSSAGRLVKQVRVTSLNTVLDVTDLASGNYTLAVQREGRVLKTEQFVIQH